MAEQTHPRDPDIELLERFADGDLDRRARVTVADRIRRDPAFRAKWAEVVYVHAAIDAVLLVSLECGWRPIIRSGRDAGHDNQPPARSG